MPIEIEVVSKEEFQSWVANDGAFTTAVASYDNVSIVAQD
jgi:heme/copper-type cytochrome/quinol oxidase subunit 2